MQHETLAAMLRHAVSIGGLAVLAACGGKEADPPSNGTLSRTPSYALASPTTPHTYEINPAATWKALVGDDDANRGPVTVIDLRKQVSSIETLAGATLRVQVLGGYESNVDGGGRASFFNVSAVFVDKKGVYVPQRADSALPSAGARCAGGDAADPYHGDFLIPAGMPARLVVPAGAVHLRLSVDDCRFIDNESLRSDPLRLEIVHAGQ